MGAFVPSPALPRGSSQAEFTPSMSLLGVTAWFEHILLALGSGVRGDVFRCSDRGHTEGGNDAEGNFQLFLALSTSGHRLNGDKGTGATYSTTFSSFTAQLLNTPKGLRKDNSRKPEPL